MLVIRLILLALGCLAFVAPGAEEESSTRSVTIIEDRDENASALVDLISQAENPAGLSVEILRSPDLGAAINIRVGARRSGYLMVLDIDTGGKLRQIFPNRATLAQAGESRKIANLLERGKTVTLPDPVDPALRMVVGSPAGIAMIVAVLSDQSLQLLDLPDVPPELMGRVEALKYIVEAAHTLRIEPRDGKGRFIEPKLSFAAKFYRVR
jgi:uncharacterized protein DUF4384